MNFILAYKYIIATFLVVFYLALPTTMFAKVSIVESGLGAVQESGRQAPAVPCGGPCNDEQGSGCCETTSCSCACHAPLASSLRLIYAPVIVSESFYERHWSLPQVYSQIFVPPQNITAAL